MAKKLDSLREMKIYLHYPLFLYPCSSFDCIVHKSYELRRKYRLRRVTAMESGSYGDWGWALRPKGASSTLAITIVYGEKMII